MTRHPALSRRRGESGFALLLIFVLAAAIAIGMMMQIPRVCFETQRDREEMLIERGEQYKRAIGLYVRKWNKYPSKIEDLENTNNIRYLRRRYIDPMTGKKEWRLVHAGLGGVLTDSLVQKQNSGVGPDGKPIQSGTGTSSSFGMNSASGMNASPSNTDSTTATDPNQPPEVNQAVKARPSDRMMGLLPGGGQTPADPSQPGQNPYAYPGSATGTGQTGAYSQNPAYPGQVTDPQQSGSSQTGQAANTQSGAGMNTGNQSGSSSSGSGTGQTGQSQAAQMIQNLLTQPRQLPSGVAGTGMGTAASGIGAGIAGIATTYKGPSIKVYDERKKYQEWEFVYDPKKEAAKQLAGAQGSSQNPGNNQGQSGTSSGQSIFQSSFGQSGSSQSGSQSVPSQPNQ